MESCYELAFESAIERAGNGDRVREGRVAVSTIVPETLRRGERSAEHSNPELTEDWDRSCTPSTMISS
jgi:hypothetical protein